MCTLLACLPRFMLRFRLRLSYQSIAEHNLTSSYSDRTMACSTASTSRSLCRALLLQPQLNAAIAGSSSSSSGSRSLSTSSRISNATAVDEAFRSGLHQSQPAPSPATGVSGRKRWSRNEIQAVYDSPLMDLIFRAATVHRKNHDPSKVQLCTLLNIK